MRLFGRPTLLIGAVALLTVLATGGCTNPLDPIDKSDKIQGLTYIDFSTTWARWDSDPEFDGLEVTIDYKNEFGDGLSFHDKPHNVTLEFWTQKEVSSGEGSLIVRDKLIFSKSNRFENSDDPIRIPIESYFGPLRDAGLDLSEDVKVFLVLRVFPPQEFPRPELTVAENDVTVYQPPEAEDKPNG